MEPMMRLKRMNRAARGGMAMPGAKSANIASFRLNTCA